MKKKRNRNKMENLFIVYGKKENSKNKTFFDLKIVLHQSYLWEPKSKSAVFNGFYLSIKNHLVEYLLKQTKKLNWSTNILKIQRTLRVQINRILFISFFQSLTQFFFDKFSFVIAK